MAWRRLAAGVTLAATLAAVLGVLVYVEGLHRSESGFLAGLLLCAIVYWAILEVMTVVRVETGFVPSTQGPPTMRSMQGLDGATQLRVHVRLRGDSRTGAAPWRASLFRLSGVDGTAAPAGATLSGGTLVPGTAVDVQLWFDLPDDGAARPRLWLAYGAEEASQRVPLGIITPAAGGHGSPSEDHHDHTTGTEGR